MLKKENSAPLLFSEFKLPEQDITKLSFCPNKPAKVKQWLESLTTTRITETSIIFYKSLPEICRLKIAPDKRISMLETLYPNVHRCIEGLMHELLHQPLMLSAQMTKLALIGQALQRHLNDGYMIALRDLLQFKKASVLQPLALCLYRAISGLGLLLLRSYQLYMPQPPTIWRKLHLLYQLAIERQLEKIPVKDSLLKNQQAMRINAAYIRNLMLACSSPHRLRQVDIMHIFQGFEQCASMVQLTSAAEDGRRSLYWVSLKSDKGPFHNHRLRGKPEKAVYAIQLDPLIHALENENPSRDNKQSVINLPVPYRHLLVIHLLRNWKESNVRLTERQSNSESLEICVGLTAIHNQLLGNNAFESLLHGHRQRDSGDNALFGNFNIDWELEEKPISAAPVAENTETLSTVKAINSSDSGYCLGWDNHMPDKVRVGELLGIREMKRYRWRIGIICWAQRYKDKVYTGIQLLSQKATAYACSTVLPEGNKSPYFRVLLLTDSNQTGQNSIITPSIPFDVDQTIDMRRSEEQMSARLTQLLLASTTISQFTYQTLELK